MPKGFVSERNLNLYLCDLRIRSASRSRKRITTGQGHGFVSEAQGLPIGHDDGIALTRTFVIGGAR
jgi:hypothetical protein